MNLIRTIALAAASIATLAQPALACGCGGFAEYGSVRGQDTAEIAIWLDAGYYGVSLGATSGNCPDIDLYASNEWGSELDWSVSDGCSEYVEVDLYESGYVVFRVENYDRRSTDFEIWVENY